MCSVVLTLGTMTFLRFAGGGPPILPRSSSVRARFKGVAQPEDCIELELGEGYRLNASIAVGNPRVGDAGGDGESESSDKGDDGTEERGEEGGDVG